MSKLLLLPEESRGSRNYRLRKKRQSGRLPLPAEKEIMKVEVLTNRQVRNRKKREIVADGNLIRLNPKPSVEIFEEKLERRVKYAAMRTHQEQAAMALAAGASRIQAAQRAGVGPHQVTKYMTSADFRERVAELRQLLFSGVQGRIISELDRRYTEESLETTELMDMLRILDRSMGGKDKGLDSITVNNYEAIFAALSSAQPVSDAEAEGEDFQEYEPQDLLLPGGDTPSF